MRKITLTTLFLSLIISCTFCTAVKTVKDKVQFASVEKASTILSKNDDYLNKLSKFDIESKVRKVGATKADLTQYRNSQLREWTEKEKEKINKLLTNIDANITKNSFKIPVPDEIILIKSTLKDEGGAEGYTRFNCIVLAEHTLKLPNEELQSLLTHEIFHIATRNDSLFKKNMYAIIGFKIMNELSYPESIKDYKISNPDAQKKDSYITLKVKGSDKPVDCMMVLYSKDDYAGGSFFEYLNIGLVKLKGDAVKEIDYTKGEATIYEISEATDFFEQIGLNTPYIIDPEEALADNFVFAINNKKELKSQWVVDKIQNVLKQ